MVLTTAPSHVAIIGGGLAGLTLALALHDLGINSTVYEARSADFDQGGGVMLSPNALRALDTVGAYQRIRSKALEFDVLSFVGGNSQVMDVYYFGSAEQYGYSAIRIMRKALLDELRVMLEEKHIPIAYEKRYKNLADVDDNVEVTFEDGDTIIAPLVIGADGIHSAVRKSIFPDVKPIYAGFMGINSVVPRSALRIPEGYPLPATVMGPGRAFLLVPQKPDGSELFIGSQVKFAEPPASEGGWEGLRQNKEGLYAMLQQNAIEWPDIVQSALEATPVSRMGFWAFHGIPPLPSWLSPSSRTILVGDAAHAIPPTAGQGANQAFEDVLSLAVLLSRLSPKVPLDKAARKWQEYRQQRIDKVQVLNDLMTNKRMPEAMRKPPPSDAMWHVEGATRGDKGQLEWLYGPDLKVEANTWMDELELSG